jgi:signal transduction histidine kinase
VTGETNEFFPGNRTKEGHIQKDLFRRTDFLHHLFDSIPSFLFIVDSDVRIFHLNAASQKLLGAERDSILLKRGGEVLHCIHSREVPEGCGRALPCKDCMVRTSVTKAFRGEKIHREMTKMSLVTGGNVAEVSLWITAELMEYEGQKFALLIMEDITELKDTEAELSRRTGELESINRQLEAFSYSVAHDLRAPLRSIIGFSDALIEDYAGALDATAGDYLSRIANAGRRMSQIIDDILKLSCVNDGGMVLEKVNLSELAREVARELRMTAPEREVEFHIHRGIEDRADARLMRIVFENLLGNAWKFTFGAVPARIEFGTVEDGGRTVYFIRDNGAGFDMNLAGKLFNPFQRLHSSEEFPGSGIGLATTRRIIHRHSGKIWAEGAPGRGAVLFFTLNEAI